MKKLFKNKIFKGVVGTLLCVCILLFAAVIGINAYMISFSKKNFVTVDELKAGYPSHRHRCGHQCAQAGILGGDQGAGSSH